ncbi:sigma-54-dependent transcriptional regulator [Stieleria varia]|uniref:Transcriptional regulatory protein ZraR n=1 Tax=Stieleria varia TaxID=2528005 RepID=A0A5C6APB8_9BACT|nr:sigma-54 dependent transcriptional regulator [Stieleria varia]TWU00956.1 Transcriptional regulatory protein ZraR [Stieleria varia]
MNESVILVVDDERAMCEMVQTALEIAGHKVITCLSADEALQRLKEVDIDAVLTDVRMPGTSGLELCQQISQLRPDVPVVVMTAFGSMELAVSAMRNGAYDFITKPVELQLLRMTVRRAVERRQMSQKIHLLETEAQHKEPLPELIGESEPMLMMYDQLRRVAPSDASILITGESGTGKEVVARCIHRLSTRAERPFVAVNCAALSESLLESELFGHEKGAFTDARTQRRGLFLEAEGGTLLLDEIGDMPIAMQVKLLRALEEGSLRPVGGDREIKFNVRVLAATHKDLESAVDEGTFRQDLFYRINVIQLHLPPLRARGTDVLRLANDQIQRFASRSGKNVTGIAAPAAQRLLAYRWPGNVRELRNVMERAVALTQHDTITIDDLPDKVRDHRGSEVFIGGDDPSELVPLEEIERRYVEHVLTAVDGNRTQAAKILGVDRKTLYRKLKAAEEEGE